MDGNNTALMGRLGEGAGGSWESFQPSLGASAKLFAGGESESGYTDACRQRSRSLSWSVRPSEV